MIVGNDVSNWQGNIDFPTYSRNTNFLIIKTTEGNGYTDPKFLRNQTEARIAGILLGYYHFARPDLGNSPESEADYFLSVIGALREGEMLCLDYEPKSNPFPVVDWCKKFLDRVYAKTGCKPLIYLNKSQVNGFNWKAVADAGYGLWLACYDTNLVTGAWSFVAMQQWTSSQAVPGIIGNVDGNWFFGTAEQFKAYGYHKPVTPSSSPSASTSPSYSISSSPSSSPSPSRSPSPSASPSPSPSPSEEESDPLTKCEAKLITIRMLVESPWTWFGKNAWYKRLAHLKRIVYA